MEYPNKTRSYCRSLADDCWNKYYNLSFSLMEDCYLSSECFEQQTLKPTLLYPLTIIYSTILLFGVIGNIITCLVISTSRFSLLQTTTNRYLINLALADLVGLVSGIPFEIYLIWNQYPWHPPNYVCHLKAWVSETTSYVSVLTIVTFSIERYIAICHSFVMRKLSTSIHQNLTPVLFLIWFVAAICAAPFGVYHRADFILQIWPGGVARDDVAMNYGPVKKTKMCMLAIAFDPGLRPVFQILFHASAILFFFLPLTVLICLYGKVGWVVKRSKRALERRQSSFLFPTASIGDRKASTTTINTINSFGSFAIRRQDYDSKKTLYILVAVVAAFFICYAPYQAQRLLFFYIEDPHTHQAINTYLFTISGVLFYMTSVVNPILYNVISARYRRAFLEVLCRMFNRKDASDRMYFSGWHRHLHQQQSQVGVCMTSRAGSRSPSQMSVVKCMMAINGRNGVTVDSKYRKGRRLDRSHSTGLPYSALPILSPNSSLRNSRAHQVLTCSTSQGTPPERTCFRHHLRRVSTVPEELALEHSKSQKESEF